MRVLVVKLSSLGDVVHALPAITDAARAIDDLEVHWVVEEAYRDIPALHPAVAGRCGGDWRMHRDRAERHV